MCQVVRRRCCLELFRLSLAPIATKGLITSLTELIDIEALPVKDTLLASDSTSRTRAFLGHNPTAQMSHQVARVCETFDVQDCHCNPFNEIGR